MQTNEHQGRKAEGKERVEMDCAAAAGDEQRYLIVRTDKGGGGLVDLVQFLVSGGEAHPFLESSGLMDPAEISSEGGRDRRWVIVVSIIIRRIIAIFGKPMEWTGILVEFLLNLLSHNGGIPGLLFNAITGKIVVPRRGSDTYISAIGQLDSRVNLYKGDCSFSFDEIDKEIGDPLSIENRPLMDLCMMASKLAYENASVVKNIVNNQWKMHFVEFYDCWNEYQKERSTQVFILSDKPKDASLVLISFRGTDPFDPNDWSTDFDYSWYEIPKLGKVHMGFLEALGLGNRAQPTTFQVHLHSEGNTQKNMSVNACNSGNSYSCIKEKDKSVEMDELTAYYAIRSKMKSLLNEHEKAKFVVTGHSLGAALAILFPAVLLLHREEELMQRLWGVYTFGQPRVGDSQLHKYMEEHICQPIPKYFRMVYCNDLVPRLPYDDKTFLYKHFGVCLYYNSFYIGQNIGEEPNPNYFGLRYLLLQYLNAVWELIRSLNMGYIYGPEYKEGWFSILLRVFGLTMPGISAHSPTNYINSLRLGRGGIVL